MLTIKVDLKDISQLPFSSPNLQNCFTTTLILLNKLHPKQAPHGNRLFFPQQQMLWEH